MRQFVIFPVPARSARRTEKQSHMNKITVLQVVHTISISTQQFNPSSIFQCIEVPRDDGDFNHLKNTTAALAPFSYTSGNKSSLPSIPQPIETRMFCKDIRIPKQASNHPPICRTCTVLGLKSNSSRASIWVTKSTFQSFYSNFHIQQSLYLGD